MYDYQTPGVYVEELASLPPSVVEVSTAIPAFIGYTTKGAKDKVESAMVATLLEYEERFGRARSTKFNVQVKDKDCALAPPVDAVPVSMLWYAMSLYFSNGGGRCWVISVGADSEGATPNKGDFTHGLEALDKLDEPTLIVMPEIVNLGEDYQEIAQAALNHCVVHRKRFAILDVPQRKAESTGAAAANFRRSVTNYFDYGAAYYPYLDTTLAHYYDDDSVILTGTTAPAAASLTPNANQVEDLAKQLAAQVKEEMKAVILEKESTKTKPYVDVTNTLEAIDLDSTIAGRLKGAIVNDNKSSAPPTRAVLLDVGVEAAKALWSDSGALKDWKDEKADLEKALGDRTKGWRADTTAVVFPTVLAALATKDTERYNIIKRLLAEQRVRLPPSPAIAGVYARVDRERGVWKAPANVGLTSVIGPSVAISHEEQEGLNVETNGKSINAIRSFAGRGTLVWGARTLAGNDNEWRYIPVRRLFLTVEESAKRATAFAVFEPNDATTWLKVKGMLESYLYGLWQQGALQGDEPKAAYYVSVGLGKTMTPTDILKGQMVVKIGLAAVRPAEFIVLKFTHKLAEA